MFNCYRQIILLLLLGVITYEWAHSQSNVQSTNFKSSTPSLKDHFDLSSKLPIIIINTEEEIPDEPKINGFMKIIDNGPGETNNENDSANNYYGHIGIEIRGQSSQMFPKKSYAVETRDESGENLNVPLLGMPEENDWVLYAPYSDKSMLRNYISYYMGRQLRTYTTRTAYCELILNDEYRGVYILLEKIKRDSKRVDIADLKPDDISGEELTGGYIIKVDKIDSDFIYGTHGWLSIPEPSYPNAMKIIFQYYHPKADELHPTQKNYIRQYITEFENNLTSSTYTNPNTGYQNYINVTSFVDQMLLNEVSKEVDKYRYSTYFYKEKTTDGGKLFAGPPWDFNLGYSNEDYWADGWSTSGWLYELVEPHDWSIMFWWKRLMESNYFKNLAYTRWFQLRSDALSDEAINYQIDSITNYIDAAQERNYQKWPIMGQYVWPNYNWQNNDYNDEVVFFRNWLFDRLYWIDENLEGETLNPQAQLSGNFPEVSIDLIEDYFSRPALKTKFFNLLGDTTHLKIDTVIYKNASSISLVLSGDKKDTREISVLIEKKVLNSYQDLITNQLELGIEAIGWEQNELRLNYTNNQVTLFCDYPAELIHQAEVFDLSGRKIQDLYFNPSPTTYIPFSTSAGIYIIRFYYKEQYRTYKLNISQY